MDEKKINKICEIMNQNMEDPFKTLLEIVRECSEEENYGIILKFLIELFPVKVFNKQNMSEVVTEEDIVIAERKHYSLLRAIVYRLVDENFDDISFYDKLYEYVFQSELFKLNEIEKVIVLYFLIARIEVLPYYQVGDCEKIDRDEFKQVVSKIKPEIKKVVHVINRKYVHRTEEASVLYDLLEKIEDKHERIILLSVMFQTMEKVRS